MGALVIVLAWAGYTTEYYGWYYSKGAPVKLLDCVLPSHRTTLLGAISQTSAGAAAASGGPPASIAKTATSAAEGGATTILGPLDVLNDGESYVAKKVGGILKAVGLP